MSDASPRIALQEVAVPSTAPTKTQRRVFAFLAMHRSPAQVAVLSSRQIAAGLAISRSTVQIAIDRLNELQWIKTYAGSRTSASEHTLLKPIPASPPPVPLDGGPISEGGCANRSPVGGPISGQDCAKPEQGVARFGPGHPQVRGPILGAFPQALYKERACARADLDLSLSSLEREGSGKPTTTGPPAIAPDSVEEVVLFAEVSLGEALDNRLAAGFRELAQRFPQVPIARICDFVALKCGEKENHAKFSPGALISFCREDLGRWWSARSRELASLIRAEIEIPWTLRKPPQLALRAQALARTIGAGG